MVRRAPRQVSGSLTRPDLSFVGSFHHSKIMLGVLVKVLCVDAIATCRRLPTKGNVAVKNLMRVASDFV